MTSFNQQFTEKLSRIDGDGLLRSMRALPAAGGRITWQGRELLNFSSNDYLNLSGDPRLKDAAKAAVDRCGCGATASRLMAGDLELHEELEQALAALVGKEAALVFPSGYQANVGMMTTLANQGDVIFSDQLNHASLIDGARLSRAKTMVYCHCDLEHLENLLARTVQDGRRIIVSDSVFSMDGDTAPVKELTALARRYEALLIIDEAHALGVFGKGGGLCRETGAEPDVVVGTLSKALGSGGGFVAGSRAMYELLVNQARSFIFSTGLAPACAGSALKAVELVQSAPEWGERLLRRANAFRAMLRARGLDFSKITTQVIPILVGENRLAVELSQRLLDRGLLVSAIRPPSVPASTARLRLSLTLAHDEDALATTAAILSDTLCSAGIL